MMKKITLIFVGILISFLLKAQFPNYGSVNWDTDYSFDWTFSVGSTVDSCYITIKEGALLLDSIPWTDTFKIDYTGPTYNGSGSWEESFDGPTSWYQLVWGFNLIYSSTDTFKYKTQCPSFSPSPPTCPTGEQGLTNNWRIKAYQVGYWLEKCLEYHGDNPPYTP